MVVWCLAVVVFVICVMIFFPIVCGRAVDVVVVLLFWLRCNIFYVLALFLHRCRVRVCMTCSARRSEGISILFCSCGVDPSHHYYVLHIFCGATFSCKSFTSFCYAWAEWSARCLVWTLHSILRFNTFCVAQLVLQVLHVICSCLGGVTCPLSGVDFSHHMCRARFYVPSPR